MSFATCHTEGCQNQDVPIDVGELTSTDPDTGETVTANVACGPCGNPITDISETEPAEGEGS